MRMPGCRAFPMSFRQAGTAYNGMEVLSMETIQDMDINQMRNIDVRTVERDSLADISKIHIDTKMPCEQRMMDFIRQVGNPYCYRCGKVVVKVNFADTSATLEDRLEHYLRTL